MKKLLLIMSVFGFFCSSAQNKIAGDWEGKLAVSGINLRVVFHIIEQGDQLSTKMDSPDQGAKGIALDQTEFSNGKLLLTHTKAGIQYEGTPNEDYTLIKGVWKQRGASFNLDMSRSTGEIKIVNKPQTPLPPFSYNSEDVEFNNADNSIHYGATFTYPKTGNSFPVIILITGSGQQDRDETIGLHKPFAVIADHLAKNGFAVLRTDDRGMGKTTGDPSIGTSADFANDVEVAINYIKTRKEINSNKIGLMGHSEGGMIAPMVATRNKAVSFVIMLAGPGIPVPDLMSEQSEALMRTLGIKEEALVAYRTLYKKLITAIPSATTKENANRSATTILNDWQKSTPKDIVVATTAITDSTSAKNFVNGFVNQCYSPWFRYFLQYDPQPVLRKLTCPVLALNGEKDVQVLAKSNLAGIRNSLQKSKSKYEVIALPGLNHLFQTCKTGAPSEYFELEETFSPKTLELITDWLKKNI